MNGFGLPGEFIGRNRTKYRPRCTKAAFALLVGIGWLPLSGCNALNTPAGGTNEPAGRTLVIDGNQDPNAVSVVGKTRGEPNDSFDDAIVAVFDRSSPARLQGTIATEDDFDVFNLGPLSPGDTVIVTTSTTDSLLDIAIALFDQEGRLFVTNDDDLETGSLDSFVQESIRHAGDPYYLAVSGSAFALSTEQRTGTYRVTVSVARGGIPPAPQNQRLLLDFDGGTLDVPTIPVDEVVPFDASAISPIYAGRTEEMKAAIIQAVHENFEGLNITIFTSDDGNLPPVGTYSTVYFGGRNFVAFGISEDVDTYNSDHDDVAVIFTESFQPRLFTVPPTVDEMGVAIGNIASHEAGHLLGLHHVNDPLALMDEANPADTFLADQEFKEAPLSPSIAPLGVQDAFLLLAEILGIL